MLHEYFSQKDQVDNKFCDLKFIKARQKIKGLDIHYRGMVTEIH